MRRPQPKHYKLNLTEAELEALKWVLEVCQTPGGTVMVKHTDAYQTMKNKIRSLG